MIDNSIQTQMDGTEAIPTIKLLLQSLTKTIIVVEGDADIRLFRKFIAENTHVQKSKEGGWIEIRKVLNECQETRVIGIRDADFTYFFNKESDNIDGRMFHTDYHDLEMTIVSVCWKSLFHEYLQKQNRNENDLLIQFFNILIPLACIRFQNEQDVIKLVFKGLSIGEYIDVEEKRFKTNEFINILNLRSKGKTKEISINNIMSLESLIQSDHCSEKMKILYKEDTTNFYFYFINGHDFLECCAKWARQYPETKDVTEKQIASSARTAYTIDLFKKTELYKSIKTYSDKNRLSFWKEES